MKTTHRLISLALALILALALASCKEANMRPDEPPKPQETPKEDDTPQQDLLLPPGFGDEDKSDEPEEYVYDYYKWPDDQMTLYTGTVEHLFFHQIIAYPELAFDGDSEARGMDESMVTAAEFGRILKSLYDNGYILVNINEVWSEYTGSNGKPEMRRNTFLVPKGKKPLVISIDDPCYYESQIRNGTLEKLIIGEDGKIWAWGHDPQGNEVTSQDLDIIPALDKFVREHPDFSLNGAKACLSLTGYEGIFGYRTNTVTTGMTEEEQAHRMEEIEAVKPIVEQLSRTGWYFGCHTWGHIRLDSDNRTVENLSGDMARWQSDVGDIVGPTTLFFYPHGGRPDKDDWHQTGEIFKYLQGLGYRIFCSIGTESFSYIKTDISAVICDRMHADGTTLRDHRDLYLKFYDSRDVYDYVNRKVQGPSA